MDTPAFNISIDAVALRHDFTPVFIYYNTADNPDNIQKAIYQYDMLELYKDDLRKSLVAKDSKHVKMRWSDIETVIIGSEFKPYQTHVVSKSHVPMDLYTYSNIDDQYIVFDKVSDPSIVLKDLKPAPKPRHYQSKKAGEDIYKSSLEKMTPSAKRLHDNIMSAMQQLSPEIQIKPLKRHAAIKLKHKTVQLFTNATNGSFKLHLTMDTDGVVFDEKTVRDIQHTKYSGNVELFIQSIQDYNKTVPLIKKALGL